MEHDVNADPPPASDPQEWLENTWAPARDQRPERREAFSTPSGLARPPLYGGAADGGLPGRYPFTRGIHPTMYRGRLWTMRQYAGFTSARETNRRFRMLLDGGQTGLSTAFDLPTQLGYDSDDPLARDEVGRVGVPINGLHDMELLLEDIPLERVSTSMTINATAVYLLACYVVLARRRGIDPRILRGTVQNDILKEYVARGNYRFPTGPSMRLTTDLMAWCAEEVPAWNTISISGYHIREAGATAVQELGFTFAHARAYVRAALAAGLAVDSFAGRLSFFFNAHNDLFEEVAKYRAARRIWARMMREEFGAAEPASWQLRFHTQTAGSMLTSQQPDNNVVRTTVQALAAVLGGTQSLHTNSRDEALSLPSEASARLALRTQQVLAHESGVADVIDPLGGAPYVEALTDELEAAAGVVLDEVERRGGAAGAIEAGHIQREIHRSAMDWQRSAEAGERVIVGVNDFQEEEEPPHIFRPDDVERGRVLTDLAAARERRDPAAVEAALGAVGRAARGDENIMPSVLTAVAAYATVGEVFGTLSEVFGRYHPPEVI
ncbi:MAG: methylmalonyl-CoA mutase family protein [Planctomycetota bacterium]|jgi:methylmalonyl-CoA mutase N-terminal domain/subunit|nr:methylmalonyl-CoA mutase family protein [Planctomycetota bacterium]